MIWRRIRNISFSTLLLFFRVISSALAASDPNDDAPVDVYYINLDRRPDRKANMEREFRAAKLTRADNFRIHRFAAIDGKVHTMSDEEKSWFRVFDEEVGKTSPHDTRLLKANSLSHMGVWKLVAEGPGEHALVFQDDATLASNLDFLDILAKTLQHNPDDAVITWIGANGYAEGSVSRSAPLDPRSYDINTISKEKPGTNGVIGICRKGLIATNSLAYILTKKGAQDLLKYYTTEGWNHHTDHALVEYLDERGISYIARTILATTMDDGILGSDIFQSQEPDSLQDCRALVQDGLKLSKFSQKSALEQYKLGSINLPDSPSWWNDVGIVCEPMNCHFRDCPAPIVTHVYLAFDTINTEECETTADGTTTCTQDDYQLFDVDASGVRRTKSRKKLLLGAPPEQVTFEHVVQNLPAVWVLEAWSKGQLDVPPAPWPLHGRGDKVEAYVGEEWLPGSVVVVGYKEDNWPTYATYVVQLDADQRLIPIVGETHVRETSSR